MISAGLDEVGWGCSAGPIVSCVVVLDTEDLPKLPAQVTDSKKLTPKMRRLLFEPIVSAVRCFGIGLVEPWEIDQLSPFFALQASYTRALAELSVVPELLHVDGAEGTNRVRSWTGKQLVVAKGDLIHKEISCASILAKIIRDSVMDVRAEKLKKLGLDYNWTQNKGYHTVDHVNAIKKYGLLFGPGPDLYHHRRSYCGKLLGKVPIYGSAVQLPLL